MGADLRRPTGRAALAIPLAAAALYALTGWPALRQSSATYDETEHVPAGYTYLTRGDYRLGAEHPPLVKSLAALPLLGLAPRVSPQAERAFAAARADIDAHWIFGDRFLYKDNPPQPLLTRARAVTLALGAALIALVWAWARRAFGPVGASFAAILAALDPNLLAHGTLATTDVGFCAFFVASLLAVQGALARAGAARVLGAGLLIGAAFATKHSAVLLVPIVLGTAVLRLWDRTPWPLGGGRGTVRTVAARGATLTTLGVIWAALAWGTIWGAYGFRYAATADGEAGLPIAQWVGEIGAAALTAEILAAGQPLPDQRTIARRAAARPPGAAARLIEAAADHRALPEGYLFGLAFARAKATIRRSFLRGEIRLTGWRGYFPFAFLVKTPATILLALVLTVSLLGVVWWRGAVAGLGATQMLWLALPPLVVMGAAMASNLNIGYRHILPLVPFVYVLLGALPGVLGALTGPRVRSAVLGAVLALAALETFTIRPHFLTFFNVAAGGPRAGIGLLSDSNLDWGQALPALRRWMEAGNVSQVNLSYFGTADPAAYGLRFVPIVGTYHLPMPGVGRAGYPPRAPVLPGLVAVSVTNLQGTYLLPGEQRQLAFLRERTPVAVPGGAIHVYRVERWGR